MKRILFTMLFAVAAFVCVTAQDAPAYRISDSLVFTPAAAVDTTLRGATIYSAMPPSVTVRQSDAIRSALAARVSSNESRQTNGFRIRIFFDNGQNARQASESVLYRFKTRFPGIPAYRTFSSPYFKVTVGDYRTRSEALSALKSIQSEFPVAFIVRETFRYPALNGDVAYIVDTIRVHRNKR